MPWTFDTHVAVRTLEEVVALTRVTLAAAGVKPDKLPPPLLVPRPGAPVDDAPKATEPEAKPHPKSWVHQLLAAQAEGVEVVGAV